MTLFLTGIASKGEKETKMEREGGRKSGEKKEERGEGTHHK